MTVTTRPLPIRVLRAAWLRLRTMRTAIILLLLLAAGAAVGSFFPQRPIQPLSVNEWIRSHAVWAPIAERLGLFDVYGAWWFMGIYGLLVVSLVGCLLPRYRAYARALRARPATPSSLDRQPHYRAGTVALAPDRALSGAEHVLRGKRFRMSRAGDGIAAEKGYLREGGSLIFHTAFLLLLFGMSIGKLYGHTGQVAVIEGERFTETRIDYDSISEGRLYPGHKGFTLALDGFDVSWYPNGVAKQFASSVRVFEGDREVRDATITVNHPLLYRGVRIYQISWGWAPVLRVTQHGKVLYDGPTIFLPKAGSWQGVAKIPGTTPVQMGLDMLFFTDPQLDDRNQPFNAGPEPRAPLVVFEQYLGDLGLDRPQNVFTLNKSSLAPAEVGAVRLGDSFQLPDGIEVAFTGLKQYSVFQVATNPGAWLLLIAAILILVGLIPALYSSRRRIWVRAAPDGTASRLEIAGRAMQRKASFSEEFQGLVRELDRDLHARIGAPDG